LPNEYFKNYKWPIRLLSLVHPFTLDNTLDHNLNVLLGLTVPFLDYKLGV